MRRENTIIIGFMIAGALAVGGSAGAQTTSRSVQAVTTPAPSAPGISQPIPGTVIDENPERKRDMTVICTTEYDYGKKPVCGIDGRTYSSSCVAAQYGVEIAHKGECKKESRGIPITPLPVESKPVLTPIEKIIPAPAPTPTVEVPDLPNVPRSEVLPPPPPGAPRSVDSKTSPGKPIFSDESKAVPVPVTEKNAPESGREIERYYKTRVQNIATSEKETDTQVEELKNVRKEIDGLIEKLIKSKAQFEAKEFEGITETIRVEKGRIVADEVSVEGEGKTIQVKEGMSVVPTKEAVLIRDNEIEVSAKEVAIENGEITVGEMKAPVRVRADEVADKFEEKIKGMELAEEEGRAVYRVKVEEPKKFLGFIPVNLVKIVTVEAEAGQEVSEKLPWYAFLFR